MLNGLMHRPTTLFLLAALGTALVMAVSRIGLSSESELAIVVGAVAIAGLPHGAADGWLVTQDGVARDRMSAIAFLASYIPLALFVIAAWWSFPIPSLAVFLAASAWHFGDDARIGLGPVARLATGIIILSAPAAFAAEEVGEAYRTLSGEGAGVIVAVQQVLFWAACAILPMILSMSRPTGGEALHLLDLAVLAVLATLLSPLLYFGVYFCGVHSPRHLVRIFKMAPVHHQRSLWVALVAMTSTSILAGVLAFDWLSGSGRRPDVAGLQVLFIGLAALTLPHMILVDGLSSALRGNRPDEA